MLSSTQLNRQAGETSHDGRAHYPGFRSRQHRIQCDAQESRQQASPSTQQTPEERRKETGNDSKVESADGDDVRSAGGIERLLDLLRNSALDPQQDFLREAKPPDRETAGKPPAKLAL